MKRVLILLAGCLTAVCVIKGQLGLAAEASSAGGNGKASLIREIAVDSAAGDLAVRIIGDGGLDFKHYSMRDPQRLVFDFYGVRNRVRVQHLVVNLGGVRSVRISQFRHSDPKIARVVIDCERELDFKVVPETDSVRIIFPGISAPASGGARPVIDSAPAWASDSIAAQIVAAAETKPAASDQAGSPREKDPQLPGGDSKALAAQSPPAQAERPEPAAQVLTPAQPPPKYTGEPISLDFKNIDLVDFFRFLSEISGLNIVLDPEIKGTLSLKMHEVPYDQVFDVVLENNGLEKKIQGNVVRVARKETLRREEEEKRKLQEAQTLAADVSIETIKLNYANAKTLSAVLEQHLSPKGTIVVDERTNTLIIKDASSPLANIRRLVRTVDVPQPQVEIEARIVSATRDFARDIGWQFGFVAGNLERVTVGGPNTFGTIGGTRPSQTPSNQQFVAGNPLTGRGQPPGQTTSAGVGTGIGSNTPGNLNLNVPAQPPNRFSGAGISLGNIFDTFLLDAAITAGEARGLAKLISQPKVTTQNNSPAKITQGIRFPVQVIQNNTVTVQFFDAALQLRVTPQITDEGTILLNLIVENNVADFSEAGRVNGIPSIRTSESSTQVLVPNGGTTVIGGILIDNETRQTQGVPGLMQIPIIGNIFKRDFISRSTQEILFFITPRIKKAGT